MVDLISQYEKIKPEIGVIINLWDVSGPNQQQGVIVMEVKVFSTNT